MRVPRLALVASLMILGACADRAERPADSTASPDTAAPAPAAPAGADSAEGAPITGRIHDVRIVYDGSRHYFEPANLTIRRGDGVRWIPGSGTPHNVQFMAAEIPPGAEAQLAANMTRTDAPLMGPMLLSESETYTVSFANVPPGTYGYICTPHQMVGTPATITVE